MSAHVKSHHGMTVSHLLRLYQDLMSFASQNLSKLRSSRKAKLYRSLKGENPYDFSQPQVQKNYLDFNQVKFL